MIDSIESLIEEVVKRVIRYYPPRLGIVKNVTDNDGHGRILCHIPALGWMTDETGVWAYPISLNDLKTPQIDSYVLIIWIDGKSEFPYYISIASHMKDQLPQAYDNNPDTQIIFNDKDNNITVKYDASADEFTIGNSDMKEAARIDDEITIDSTTDPAWAAFVAAFNTWSTGVTPPLPVSMPDTISGAITTGSSQVKIGDK